MCVLKEAYGRVAKPSPRMGKVPEGRMRSLFSRGREEFCSRVACGLRFLVVR